MPDSIDQALVRRCSEGDRKALAAAVQLYLPSLMRYARSHCEGELAANEIVLRAIERAGRDLRSCAEATSVLAWLLHSVHLACSSVHRPSPAR
ncbi:MAG TPA: hypothetical protein VGK67_30595 [Myxococcales bacterium]